MQVRLASGENSDANGMDILVDQGFECLGSFQRVRRYAGDFKDSLCEVIPLLVTVKEKLEKSKH